MSTIIAELEKWGPGSNSKPLDQDSAKKYTWGLATSHYENFPVISWAVPKPLRQHFANVYAFCRWADDLGDEIASASDSLRLLEWWQAELENCYRGECVHPVFTALHTTIEQFSIPITPFANLISAFIQDQSVTTYETFSQLEDYCQRSANPVGRIVLHLANCNNTANEAYSDSICTGLQLANFWQDVRRDKLIGRVYLPSEDRQRFGYSEKDLMTEQANDAFRELMAFEVDRTRNYLIAGRPLVGAMPGRLKVDIDLMIRGGLLVLSGIEKVNFNVWKERPIVRKSQLFTAGLLSLFNLAMPRPVKPIT
ncbi:squalene synthase HpnC [Thalassoglobus polymorphus]|uniref:All-trans-phytoene synthase n=1 Tax=Thalassoglobus polymorphus TaxID=2527994 RepID=A0A517QIL4_9PLAN|nr:squalene synthase HpnC [Thalassoglobus polymorphus]QDT31490.1 All-trans-phytoene synthase [Thalassoglobus polymorphus]